MRRLGGYLSVSRSVRKNLREQYHDDMELKNEVISWWLQSSPYALDSWKWLSGQLLHWEEKNALAGTKRYINESTGMCMIIDNVYCLGIDYRATCIYMYRIGNGITCAIDQHSNAPETLPRILRARKDLVKGHLSKMFVKLMDKLSRNLQRKPGSALF